MNNDFEKHIPYIVQIKEQHLFDLRQTTIGKQGKFVGYLVNNNDGNFYFELNGSKMLIIIPHSYIQYMCPSRLHFELYIKNYAEK